MGEIFFTADLHLNHKLVAENRGFTTLDAEGEVVPDTAAHDAALADAWDRVVGKRDQVWVLGDLCIGRGWPMRHAIEWIGQRPGTKHLIWGNHDMGHPSNREAHRWQSAYWEVFASCSQSAVRKVSGQRVLLNHLPYSGDHTAIDRFPEWRPVDTGLPLLHGHTHSERKVNGRMLHVGADAWDLELVPLAWVERSVMALG